MKVSHNEAMQSYNNAMGFSLKAGEYLQGLKQRFIGVNISMGIPSASNVFEEKGNNHLMIPNNILQKILKDKDYADDIEKDFRVFEKQMKRDSDNESIQSSGFFVNLDGSYGGWSIAKQIVPHDSSDVLRQAQHAKALQAQEVFSPEGVSAPREPQKSFAKKLVIENGEIIEQEVSTRNKMPEARRSLELWA